MAISLRYFAALREAMGCAEENLSGKDMPCTVAALIPYLAQRDARGARAFADPSRIYAAVNCILAQGDTPIHDGDVVDLFPPVTGG
jgi:sulfur-carrier protein